MEKAVKNNLKKITDKTLQDLLQNEIILPSTYFETFDQNAKELHVNIQDNNFENEVSDVLTDEFKRINDYMRQTTNNLNTLSEATQHAQQAIKDKDESKLKTINSTLVTMKNEIDALRDLVYLDTLTKTFNRKWIYNHMICEDGTFNHSGLLLFIDINDCNYLATKYGSLLADHVVLYISKYLTSKLRAEHIVFDIARYSSYQFAIFVQEAVTEEILSLITNIRIELENTTLKSKSGLRFKTTFNFGSVEYTLNNDFQNTVETAASLATQERETLNG